ncbi:DUF4435 domain-containing protein [Pseudomonas moraviensis]|uniref:DUF4435 domain-containing protein n=1 Tax=Pseudomonas moraviensis TaxID=321662 RepID=A0A7Z0ASP7_9PSED|nr:DUF4435 domain-containing protein [Pseudomonas moraviensis]NYH08241.1 hypothetical protein [Pseudomonas moraviensis]
MYEGLPENLAYEADELLNSAIMNKLPVVIVEGCDDIPIYERLALQIGLDCEVYASEYLLSGKAGCVGVTEHLTTIREGSQGLDIKPHILGIIDRDARFYRGELSDDDALLILNYYSIESHFVSAEAVRFMIESTTRATRHLVTEEDSEKIFEVIKAELGRLYFFSLEALRNACDSEYDARFGYGDKIRTILNSGHEQALEAVREGLEAFASEKAVPGGWEGVMSVCKGKWLLEMFLVEVKTQVSRLPSLCSEGWVTTCQSCLKEVHKNCLYRVAANFDGPQMKQFLMGDLTPPAFNYIRERMMGLVHV